VEPKRPAPAASPGSWSVVSETGTEPEAAGASPTKKGRQESSSASWQLASGEAPETADAEEEVVKTQSALVPLAQYAILVVGLVMVLIGVLVMIANSHVT
jgi:cobalamin biosynthesis Mg chelatase CobN